MAFLGLIESVTFAGHVKSIDETGPSFKLECRSGDTIDVFVGPTDPTTYQVLQNVDGFDRDRTEPPADGEEPTDPVVANLRRYIAEGALVFVQGIHQQVGDRERFEARAVYLLKSNPGMPYAFEEPYWWLNQTSLLIDRWLDDLFDASRDYTVSDFSKFYVTNLNIVGQPMDNDDLQECATLSRLIYGLSSAYLLTGAERYFLAARAAVSYQRQAFRTLTSDGTHCFWAFGRRRKKVGDKEVEVLLFPSENDDDKGTIPLYEQIYALAGLAQYYRITADWEVLEDIRRTMNAFDDYFLDDSYSAEKPWATGKGGYLSHLDPITRRPDTPQLAHNKMRKNWNSIGDHIPAYLINLVLALDPPPRGGALAGGLADLGTRAVKMLESLVRLIVEHFPDETSDYVNERFDANWNADHDYRWQQDRAIVGHNLKIAWNLTRCAFHLESRASQAKQHGDSEQAQRLSQLVKSCHTVATRLADRMAEVGVDKMRGGVFDAVQRHPDNGMPTQFAWGSTKDFWQQEQGILAYLALYGATRTEFYLEMAQECMAFWNLFFLDRDNQGIYFRTTEGGLPWVQGMYGQKGGHSISGYHVFELNYLADLYLRTHLLQEGDRGFCLYFRVQRHPEQTTINVLPDFFPQERVEIKTVRAGGIDRTQQLKPNNIDEFQVRIDGEDIATNPDGSIDLVVEFAVH